MLRIKLKAKQRILEKWSESKLRRFCYVHIKFSIVLKNEWDKNRVSLMLFWQIYNFTALLYENQR